MEVLGLALKHYEDIGVITENDLFELSEQEIIFKILDCKHGAILEDILSLKQIFYANKEDNGLIIVSKPKIRQASPIVYQVNFIEN